MKLGILGTGMIVKDLLTTIDQLDIESISILGTEQTRDETENLKHLYKLDRCYFDYDELLMSDIDTVYIALPNHLHYSFSKRALENNKHVIIEKPITANIKELENLKSIAYKNNLIILEAMNIHYLPAYKEIKKQISLLGSLKIVSMNYSQYSSRYNAFKEGTILPAFDYTKAGGALYDINVYNIHFVIGLFGRPVSVQYLPNIEKGIDTSGILTLDYNDYKVICIGAKDCASPVMCTIQGDQGNIVIKTPVNQLKEYVLKENQGAEVTFNFDESKHRLYYEFVEFIDIINNLKIDEAQHMLEISSIVSDVMTSARQSAGIVFNND